MELQAADCSFSWMTITHSFASANCDQPGLLLLFGSKNRPNKDQIAETLNCSDRNSITHDPTGVVPPSLIGFGGEGDASCFDHTWLELCRDGLTFDLVGLSPGPSLAPPADLCPVDDKHCLATESSEAIGLFPGPHLAEGASSLPIVRTQLALALDLVDRLDGVVGVCWTVSGVVMPQAGFSRIVADWIGGGRFPAKSLVRLGEVAPGRLCSSGLGHFIGQEIQLPIGEAQGSGHATDLAWLLIHELVAIGPVDGPIALDIPGRQSIHLEPSADGAVVRVDLS